MYKDRDTERRGMAETLQKSAHRNRDLSLECQGASGMRARAGEEERSFTPDIACQANIDVAAHQLLNGSFQEKFISRTSHKSGNSELWKPDSPSGSFLSRETFPLQVHDDLPGHRNQLRKHSRNKGHSGLLRLTWIHSQRLSS